MQAGKKILFLIVNYYNDDEVKDFIINELLSQTEKIFDVSLVNNGSKDEAGMKNFCSQYSFIRYLYPQKNLGYLGAANYALENYLKSSTLPNLVIVCNTDIELRDKEFLHKLTSLTFEPSAGVIGPSVISTVSNKDFNPYIKSRETKKHLEFLSVLYRYYFLYVLYEYAARLRDIVSGKKNSQMIKTETYAVHGSFMIFIRHYFESGATLKFPSFLYGEEIFIAEQARLHKAICIYNPAIVVYHREHATTHLIKTPHHVRFMRESVTNLLNEYFK